MARIRCIDGANFVQRPSIKDVNLSGKVAKPSQRNQSSLRIEGYEVPGVGAKVRSHFDSLIEQDCLGGDVYNVDVTSVNGCGRTSCSK